MIKPRRLEGEGLAIVLDQDNRGNYTVDLLADQPGQIHTPLLAQAVTLYAGPDFQDALVYYGAGERLVNAIITWKENEALRIRSEDRRMAGVEQATKQLQAIFNEVFDGVDETPQPIEEDNE